MTKEEKRAIEDSRCLIYELSNHTDKDFIGRLYYKNKPIEENLEILLNLIEKLQEENEQLKNAIAVANKLEERMKEDFIPKEKIVDIIEKISLYKKLAKDILNKKEKEYLSNVIKPFKSKVKRIVKRKFNGFRGEEYISIRIENDYAINLPNFKKSTMYKNMKLDKKYTLEELEL